MVQDEQEFLSIKEFASYVRVHENTVRRAIKAGRLNGFKLGKGKNSGYRIPKTEVNRLSILDLEKVIDQLVIKRLEGK